MNADSDRKPNKSGFVGMNVMSPGGIFNTGMGNSASSAVVKELRNKHNNPDTCAGCGANSADCGKALLLCLRCKDQKHCSVGCQKKSWKVHKKLCEPAKASK